MRYTTRFTMALGLVGSIAFAGAAMAGTGDDGQVERSDEPNVEETWIAGPHGGGQLLHGEHSILLEDGTVATMTDDAGTITAIDGRTLSIERADGSSLEVTLLDGATIVRNGDEADAADLAVGDLVNVHQANGLPDGDRMHVFARTEDWEPSWKPFGHHHRRGPGRFMLPAPRPADGASEDVIFIGEDVAA